jgi:hypothetical protein
MPPDDDKNPEDKPEDKPDNKPDPKPEPKPEPKDPDDPFSGYSTCPECDATIKSERLGNHRWSAHQVERRAKPRTDEELEAPEKKEEKKKTPEKRRVSAWFG